MAVHKQEAAAAWKAAHKQGPTAAWAAAHIAASPQLPAQFNRKVFPFAIVCGLYNLGQDLVDRVTFLVSFLGLRSLLLPSRREFPFTGNSHTAGMQSG